MGSITAAPKAPQPTVIYQTAPAPTPVAEPATVSEAVDTAETRKSDLLRRSRGRLGTIQTGFRGLVSAVNDPAAGSKKTLLGE